MVTRRALAVGFGTVIALVICAAATYPRFRIEERDPTAIAAADITAASSPAVVSLLPGPAILSHHAWTRLTNAQHLALAPFAATWDSMNDETQVKWLKIAARYQKMSPEVQERLHARMTDWIKISPQERRTARENYQLSRGISAKAREDAWKAYQKLPDDQKKKLAAAEKNRRPTVVSAPITGKREVQNVGRLAEAAEPAPTHAGSAAPMVGVGAQHDDLANGSQSGDTSAANGAPGAGKAGTPEPSLTATPPAATAIPGYPTDTKP